MSVRDVISFTLVNGKARVAGPTTLLVRAVR
jgi:hypothetical protein